MQYQDVLVQFPVSITLAMLAEAAFGRGLALSSTFLPEPASHWAGSWQERAQGQPGRNPGTLIHAGTATLTFPCLGVGTGHSESAGNQLCLQHLVLFSFLRIQWLRKRGNSFHYPGSGIAKRQRLMPLKHKQLVLKHNMADLL